MSLPVPAHFFILHIVHDDTNDANDTIDGLFALSSGAESQIDTNADRA